MVLGAPQIIFLILFAMSLALNMADHGKPKTGKNNFFISLLSTIIIFALLLWGGFFTK